MPQLLSCAFYHRASAVPLRRPYVSSPPSSAARIHPKIRMEYQALASLPVGRTRARWLVVLGTISLSCSAASCQGQGQTGTSSATAAIGAASQSRKLDDYVSWERDLQFTESAASASIRVYFDPKGGFIVADAGQSQIRVYTDDSHLLWSAGRSGEGPQEFEQLRNAVRLSSGEVVALDITGRLTFYSPEGEFKRTVPTRLNPTFNSWLLNDSTLLISGRPEGVSNPPLLHVWNLQSGRNVASFFRTPPHDPAFDEAYRYSGWASAADLGGDSIAVVFPLSDTLYLYRADGTPLGKLGLPLEHFVRLREPAPRDESAEARIAWRNSYSLLSQVFRSPDGSMYVQYSRLSGVEPMWGVSRLFLQRGRLHKDFEVPEAPRLLGISHRDTSLHFLRADSLESTVWSIAKLSH